MASKSPISTLSQQRKISSSTPPPQTAAATATTKTVPFPSPQTFDFIPPLHALIVRLLSSSAGATTGAAGTQSTVGSSTLARATTTTGSSEGGSSQLQQKKQSQSQQQPSSSLQSTQTVTGDPSSFLHSSGGSGVGGTGAGADGNVGLPPLEAKDLSTAASAVRIRIQKARGVVSDLPDVDRTIDEQTEEIEELQNRIACLNSVIADFGRRAAATVTATEMTGEDGGSGGDKMDVGV